ncbi:hypothetical protein Celaphus_00007388, partial [Cervus elaphus hippelaphus]
RRQSLRKAAHTGSGLKVVTVLLKSRGETWDSPWPFAPGLRLQRPGWLVIRAWRAWGVRGTWRHTPQRPNAFFPPSWHHSWHLTSTQEECSGAHWHLVLLLRAFPVGAVPIPLSFLCSLNGSPLAWTLLSWGLPPGTLGPVCLQLCSISRAATKLGSAE